MLEKHNTTSHSTPKQGILPMFPSDLLPITDKVFVFDHLMEGINLKKYLKAPTFHTAGRPRYNQVDLLKTVLFGFMSHYTSLRQLEDACRTNLRFMYLMNNETPSYKTFGDFINSLSGSIEDIFLEINKKIFTEDNVDLDHLYIDGTKLEADANKYSWVWKKATITARNRLFAKITKLFDEINEELQWAAMDITEYPEYTPDYLRDQLDCLADLWKIDKKQFVHGCGHHKAAHQRWFEELESYANKLEEYGEKIEICGPDRNSYSKTDHDATFMRIKKDYMGNDQLLPAYNIQFGVCDEYIAAVLVSQSRSDMACFIPLMKKFHEAYGFFPRYPVADAGYGSLDNYIFCKLTGMQKYMKFPMYKKETKDKKYHNDPFRAVNFEVDQEGTMWCPNYKAFHLKYRKPIQGNKYGREEEIYQCEDCAGCPYAENCKRGKGNRTIYLNKELTAMHEEVLQNLESIKGAFLRMNRSIQSEGTFGIVKNDHGYKRIRRRSLKRVKLEIYLIAIGQNLNKYYHKRTRQREIA